MKELGRLLNRKTILLILAAACICVVAVFAGDFSDCGIDNYKIKVREYNWLINGHTDEQIQEHADELAQDERRIFKRLAKEYIYDPSHSEEQAALFLDAAGTEEWTLEDLRTLAAQSDIDSMKILQRKIEQLHKASQKKNNK